MKLLRVGITLLSLCLLLGGCPLGNNINALRDEVRSYTVTFNSSGGSAIPEQTVKAGGKAECPENPTRSDYTFYGWCSDAEQTTGYDFSRSIRKNITLYAKWNPITYTVTVTFEGNGGSGGITSAQTVNLGSSITLSGLTRTGYTFGGWNTNADGTGENYRAGSSYRATASVTLYAKWELITIVPGTTLAARLSWLQTNAASGVDYTLEVDADESIAPQTLSYSGRSNIGVTLRGSGASAGDANRTISLSSNGTMFTVVSGVTLVLDNNITLQGHNDNTNSMVHVDGGTLIMNAGKISGNTISGNTSSYGGGVLVSGGGTFTMNGGEISGNTVSVSASSSYSTSATGGGVSVSSGTFIMSGGEISGNTASSGGGVYVGGTFTMNSGEISDNTASSGGGVYVGGTFTMNSGEISGNTASSSGGGVYVGGTFTMNGGEISGNTGYAGGGVFVIGTFTMSGGEISGNTASSAGGGVYVNNENPFKMEGGTISGNTAPSGGGVHGKFYIITGTVYGSDAGDLQNTANNGAALFGTAEYGTLSGLTWWNKAGSVNTANSTIRVINGVLQ